MKKQNYVFNLPTQLKEDLHKIDFGSTIRKNHALRFIHILRNKGFHDNHDMLKYQELSSKWFRKVFNPHYKKQFLDLLIKNNIIERNDSYSEELGYSKSYRIQKNYYAQIKSYSDISYSDNSSKDDNIYFYSNNSVSFYNLYPSIYIYPTVASLLLSFPKKAKKQYLSSLKLSFSSIKKKIITDMIDSLNIDYVSIMNTTKEVVAKVSTKNFIVDKEVEYFYFKVYNRVSNNSYYTSKENALSYCRKAGLTLIQDNDRLYIDDLDRYVETKKINIYSAYTQKTADLKKGIYHPDRNKTNYRLDTIFTSMCSHTMDIIKKDNNLIEIDLVNSQFAILGNWLMSEDCYQYEDVKLFCKLAIEGGLYEYLIVQLNAGLDIEKLKAESSKEEFEKLYKKLRKQAKKMMFMICFADYRFHSPLKDKFKELFYNVNVFIDSFKREADDSNEFSIELQKKESKVFIDGLMRILLDRNLFVLTKHDSLIIKEENKDEILEIVFSYFERINLRATIAVEDAIVHNEVLSTPIRDQVISAIDTTMEGTGADNEEKNAIYAEMVEKVRKEYELTKIYDRKMAWNSIILLEQMEERYFPYCNRSGLDLRQFSVCSQKQSLTIKPQY